MGQYRPMIEATLFNLRYDMDCIGAEAEMWDKRGKHNARRI